MIKASIVYHTFEVPDGCATWQDAIRYGWWAYHRLALIEFTYNRHGNLVTSRFPKLVFHPRTGKCPHDYHLESFGPYREEICRRCGHTK